ncbi:MAG TPA: acyl--CoA ligase [Candidatus Saccharimonadales bacterium]|nr:acyl--CoA ligase [Candidatus Saccharimonadales bacterium]
MMDTSAMDRTSGQTAATLLELLEGPPDSAPAIVVPDGPELSYGALRRQVRRTADALAEFGIGRGDRVALVLPNGAEVIIAFLGAAVAATAAPLNPGYTEDEFRFYLDDTDAKAVIVPPGGAAAARAAAGSRMVIETALDPDGEMRFSSTTARQPGRTASPPSSEDVALVLHTSGTTSRPKRVPLKHRNLTASVEHIVDTYALTSDDVALCVMPLFHVHGLVASTLSTLSTGGTVVVPPRFDPLGFWSLLTGQRVTWYTAVPTIHQLVLARSGRRADTKTQLRFVRSCSSALAPATMGALEKLLGVPVLEAYGMTEAAHQMASNPLPPAPRVPGSVGHGTGVRIAIMDEAGQLLPVGTHGEVVIQGPNVTDGYENNPEANAAGFTDGWFRTGDLGTLDDAGYLTLLGRLKELINRGGEKIAPREIDEVLLLHPAVGEAVAFGLPHRVWGEEVAVAVVLKGEASEADLLSYCREHLAEFKVPRKLFVVASIPRTATGKVQRRHVAAEFGGQG